MFLLQTIILVLQWSSYDSEILKIYSTWLILATLVIKTLNCSRIFFKNESIFNLTTNKKFDLIISNPPFHFEHETNIEVALNLFKEVKRCLKKGGSFQLVTSNHLNSKTHLNKLFHKVNIIAQNEKFVVYHCV